MHLAFTHHPSANRLGQRFGFEVLPLPRLSLERLPVSQAACLADILQNIGFGDEAALAHYVQTYEELISVIDADVVICDHSPTALLATEGKALKRVMIGTGFCCPPHQIEGVSLRPWLSLSKAEIIRREDRLLNAINRVSAKRRRSRLQTMHQLFDVDGRLLTTIPEMDVYRAYRSRRDVYVGVNPPLSVGVTPVWRGDSQIRIGGYLKHGSKLRKVVRILRRNNGIQACFYVPGLKNVVSEGNVTMLGSPICISGSLEFDFAILNGTHNTTLQLLLRGIPTLQVPLLLEQRLTSRILGDIGVCVCVDGDPDAEFEGALRDLLKNQLFYRNNIRNLIEQNVNILTRAFGAAAIDLVERLAG